MQTIIYFDFGLNGHSHSYKICKLQYKCWSCIWVHCVIDCSTFRILWRLYSKIWTCVAEISTWSVAEHWYSYKVTTVGPTMIALSRVHRNEVGQQHDMNCWRTIDDIEGHLPGRRASRKERSRGTTSRHHGRTAASVRLRGPGTVTGDTRRRHIDIQTDRQRDRQTDRRTAASVRLRGPGTATGDTRRRQTETDGQTDARTDSQTNRHSFN